MSGGSDIAPLEITQALLAQALRNVREGVCISDRGDVRRYVNDAFAEIFGYEPEELIGRPVSMLRPPDFAPERAEEVLRETLEHGSFEGELVNVCKDGRRILVAVTTAVLRDGSGGVVAFFGTARDVTAERRRQEELEENENRYRMLFEAESDAIVLVDAADGRILDANQAAVELYGYSRDELLAMRNTDVSAEPRETRAATASDTTRIPVRWHRRRDGTVFPVEITARHLEWRGSRCHIAAIRDITERMRAQQALEESEQRLRDIVDHSTNFFYAHGTDHVLTYVSPQSRQFFDCEPEEAMRRWTELATDNPINQRGFELTQRAIDTGERQPSYELELVGLMGRTIWVEVNEAPVVRDGRTVAIVGALTDITQRRQAEQALAESERNYREIFNATAEAILIADATGGRVLDVNDSMLRMYGYGRREEVVGQSLARLNAGVSPSTAAEAERWLERAIEEGPQVFEWLVRRGDGDDFWAEVSLRSSQIGGRGRVLAVVRDITERRELEERLRHSHKIEALGRLAGGVAHDFNNLLQAILSTAQTLHVGAADRETSVVSEEIGMLVSRGAALARQLLLFARREVARRHRVDVAALAERELAMLRRLLPENMSLEMAPSAEPLPVEGDAGQLEQVLLNLVVNARDAMPTGGRLVVRTGADGEEVWFEVEDTGHGMDEIVRQRLFEPFFTTKPASRGTGLGLAVVHGIVTAHGGRVEVDSRVGEGTRVRVVLPRAPGGAIASGDRPTSERPHHGLAGETVLLVEDDPGIRDAMQRMLEGVGYRVSAVESAEAALELACDERFDVLLSDVMLPGRSGVELAAEISGRWPRLATLLMSGYAEDAVLQGAPVGCRCRFLQKPVDLATLTRELRAALADAQRTPDP